MGKLFGTRHRRIERLFRVFIFFLAACFIVYLLPREGKFRYEFQKGKPWFHDTFIAPFDFPIYKTDEEIAAEKDSIERATKPYYRLDHAVKSEQVSAFFDHFETRWKEFLAKYYRIGNDNKLEKLNEKFRTDKDAIKEYIAGLLNFVYDKGVIELTGPLKKADAGDLVVVLATDNLAEEYYLSEIFSAASAVGYINGKMEEKKLSPDLQESELMNFFITLNPENNIIPNYYYDAEKTQNLREISLSEISPTRGMVQQGERIISKGDVVNTASYRVLLSLKKEYEANILNDANLYMILLGQIILVFIAVLVLYLFLLNFRKDILHNSLKTTFIIVFVLLMVGIATIVLRYDFLSIYLIPFTILPVIIRAFYDTRLALFIHLVTILIIGFFAPNGYEFVFIQLMAGIVAIFSLASISRRGQLFLSAVIIMATYSLVYFGISVLQEGDISGIHWKTFAWFGGNGLLLLSSYPLIYVFEKVFGFLSDVTLMELSDTNHPILRELSEKAPGTFQHSLQVGNLAENVIQQIGGNPRLARTGALYHDIGKMEIPQYFIENQVPGQNPHDKLEYDESAAIIISHVIKGVERAKKHNLPPQIIDFIRTHHGTSKVHYFYRNYLKIHPDLDVDEKKFSYPGPSPFTREQAVVMMCDSVEAASRSLKTITEEAIDELVEKIINFQIEEDQFKFADITFKDITTAKSILRKKLRNIYHTRIEYPE